MFRAPPLGLSQRGYRHGLASRDLRVCYISPYNKSLTLSLRPVPFPSLSFLMLIYVLFSHALLFFILSSPFMLPCNYPRRRPCIIPFELRLMFLCFTFFIVSSLFFLLCNYPMQKDAPLLCLTNLCGYLYSLGVINHNLLVFWLLESPNFWRKGNHNGEVLERSEGRALVCDYNKN